MITYILKILICSGLLWACYVLFLQKQKMYSFNRLYLLFSVVISFSVPFISFQWESRPAGVLEPVYYIVEEAPAILSPSFEKNSSEAIRSTETAPVLWIYGFISLILFFRFANNLLQLRRKARKNENIQVASARLVLLEAPTPPHSFLSYVFVNRRDYLEGKIEKQVMTHELSHVQQKHSLDILFMEMVLIIGWFNPFFYAIKKAMQLNHEFLADQQVIQSFPDIRTYQHLLLEKSQHLFHSAITSSFNYSITKKRLIMMTKTSSGRARILSQLAVLPVLVFILLALCTDIAAQNTVQEKNKAQDQAPNKTQDADTTKYPVWVGMSIGHTEEGVSPAMVEEYKKIIGKYMKGGRVDWERLKQIPKEERDRLETIYKQMNLEQQSRQEVIFIKRPNPLPKVVPSEKQFAGFKKPDVYGVWIDGKKVSNATLGKYQHTDFSSVFISNLYGAAKKGRSYTHQVDLMTKDYYEEYYRNAMKEPRTSIVVRKLPGKQE